LDGDSKLDDELISNDGNVLRNKYVNECPLTDGRTTTGFGLAYTDAQYIETKLANILNDIQAPKFLYSSVLRWAQEAHMLGYNFVPWHGTKDSLISSLQSQLHLDHFHFFIELPGDKMEVEVTRFNFVDGLHYLLSHPGLTGSLENLDVNPVDPFGK
jgi:hypothetical protein